MAKKNILVIDDDRDLTQSIKVYFEARGFDVRTAHSGAAGMSEIEHVRPDLIVLDIMMDTDADGFNLAFKLKNDETYRDIPIIIMSGFSDHLKTKSKSFEFVMDREWPASEYLKKPASLASIDEAVRKLLD
ncbi:MAG TPA: response regulator [Acidobacteriota bacterium]|nr:response regulator [Acidobacteriota bacterium]